MFPVAFNTTAAKAANLEHTMADRIELALILISGAIGLGAIFTVFICSFT